MSRADPRTGWRAGVSGTLTRRCRVRAMPAGCSKETRRLASEYNWVIIDGFAGTSRVSAEAVRAADLVVIPAKPSPYHVGGVRHRGCREGSADQWWRLPQSRFRHHLGDDPHVPGKADCDGHRGIRVSGTYVRTTERVAYLYMATKGRSVLDGRDRTSRDDILALRDEIEKFVNDASQ